MTRLLAAAWLAAAALFAIPSAPAQQGLTGNWNLAVVAQAKFKDLGTFESASLDELSFNSATTFSLSLEFGKNYAILLDGDFSRVGKRVVFEISSSSREELETLLETIAYDLALASGNPPPARVRIDDLKLVVKYKNSANAGEQIGMKMKAKFVVIGSDDVSRKGTFLLVGAGTPM